MKTKTELEGFFDSFKVWLFAVGLQYIVVQLCSLLFLKVWTVDFIMSATQVGPTMASFPFMVKLAYTVRHVFAFIGEYNKLLFGFLLMVLMGWIFLKREQITSKVSIAMFISTVLLIGLAFLVGKGEGWITWGNFVFLAESMPLWAYLTYKFSNWDAGTLKGKDFANVGEYQRGARLIGAGKASKAFTVLTHEETPRGTPSGISIWGDEPFPFTRENQHFLITGSPGSGKTQIIYPMITQVLMRGDKAIIWDVKGTFIQAFADKEGVDLLAAWDKRSIAWSPGMDIINHLDCQQVASIMIPPNPRESQPYFLNAARQILEAILIYLDSQGDDWGWGDVWAIVSKDRKEVATLLSSFADGKAVAQMISGDSKSTEDVYSTLITQVQTTVRWYAKAWPQKGVSLRKWIHGNSKALIIGGIPQQSELAQATANIAIQIIVNEILSLPDDPNRRIWLFLDELATLGKLEALLKAFSLGRSKGLCVVAGIQDIGKIEHHYGPMLAKSIANTFSTMIFLRCSDVDTSQWASDVLGEQDILEVQRSRGRSGTGLFEKSVTTENEQRVLRTRPVFMPSEISHFENLTGVIRISGWPLLRLRWPYNNIPQTSALMEGADWLNHKSKPSGPSTEPPASSWRLDP